MSALTEARRPAARPSYRRFWVALRRRDVDEAARLIDVALHTFGAQQVYLRIFAPALALSGSEFAAGRITFNDEHFITHQIVRLMRRVRREFVVRDPTGPLALAGAVAQEHHRIGLRMVCDFLQSDNWRIYWLDGVERARLRQAIVEHRPDAILLSVGMIHGIEPTARLIAEARRRCGFDGLIVVGGRAIAQDPSLVERIGADLSARDGLDLLRKVRSFRRGTHVEPVPV